ncbi:MAG: gliding motility protein GldD [Tannerellaceae bacterium]|jgi:gliding motility-associated lipoprotein GldD|nr:gliding motility protein GldD [Tannerellaceae bacterium]
MRKETALINIIAAVSLAITSCSEYSPKPRGYLRIEPPEPEYLMALPDSIPYSFCTSSQVEVRPAGEGGINLAYPALSAVIYCSYLRLPPASLHTAVQEARRLMHRQIRDAHPRMARYAFDNPERKVYATLYIIEGDSPSPVQFMLTDSATRFFRGALYYDCPFKADSLEPVTSYIAGDIMELIHTFTWKN